MINNKQKKQLKEVVFRVVGFALLGITGVVALAVYNKIKGRPLLDMYTLKKTNQAEQLDKGNEVLRSTDKQ